MGRIEKRKEKEENHVRGKCSRASPKARWSEGFKELKASGAGAGWVRRKMAEDGAEKIDGQGQMTLASYTPSRNLKCIQE